MGLPVLRTLSLCTCCRHYPGAAAGRTLRSASPSRISLPRKGCRVGLRIVLFEDCSAFTRVTACTLALSPIRDTLIEGFSHFVASMTAPIASGWSGCRVGSHPLESAALSRRTPKADMTQIRAECASELAHNRRPLLDLDTRMAFDRCRSVRVLRGALLTRRTSDRASSSKVSKRSIL